MHTPQAETIFEYMKGSHPWFDTTEYTVLQIALFFIGSMLWLVAYIDTLIDIFKKKTLNIPLAAICLNFGWEVATCWFFVPNMGKVIVIAYWAWMCVDLFIFSSTFKYGYKQLQSPYFIKNIRIFLVLSIIVSFATQLTFLREYDLPMAPLSGYIINLIMSVGFLGLLYIPGFEGNSLVTGWSKFLGTGLVSLMFCSKYPDNYFLISMYIAVAAFDIIYIYLLYKKRKAVTA